MDLTPENITEFRLIRWRVKAARIAAAMCGGWPLSDGIKTREYQQCLERLHEAEAALARFPPEWHQRFVETNPDQPPSGITLL